jgi:hypothetical protein
LAFVRFSKTSDALALETPLVRVVVGADFFVVELFPFFVAPFLAAAGFFVEDFPFAAVFWPRRPAADDAGCTLLFDTSAKARRPRAAAAMVRD